MNEQEMQEKTRSLIDDTIRRMIDYGAMPLWSDKLKIQTELWRFAAVHTKLITEFLHETMDKVNKNSEGSSK